MPSTYLYEPDETETNVVLVYATDELVSTSLIDPMRKELGFVYSVATSSAEGSEFLSQAGNFTIAVDQLRDFNVVQMSTFSPYIDKIEIMPSRIKTISPTAMFPNYKIPVRLYANEALSRGDAFWRTFFVGGEYGGDSYPGLINQTTIYSDYSFTYANSYPVQYAKSIGISETTPNLNTVLAHYNSYNVNIRDHLAWEKEQKSPLLIPSWYALSTVAIGPETVRQLSPGLQSYLALSASNEEFGRDSDSLKLKLIGYTDRLTDSTAKSFYEAVYLPKLRTVNFSEGTRNDVIESQRNIIIGARSVADAFSGPGAGAPLIEPAVFPYYNTIEWPTHKQNGTTEPGPGTAYDGLNTELYFIRNAIERNGFDAKFLETLKDIHEESFPNLTFGSKDLNMEISGQVLTDKTDYGTHMKRRVTRRPHRTIDLVKMMQLMYNQPSAALNDNYTFVGAADPSYQTTYDDNLQYRYYDNKNLVESLDDIYSKIKTKYNFPQVAADWSGGTTYSSESVERITSLNNTRDVMNYIFNPNYCHSETIAYRVEKSGGSTDGDYNKPEVIQNFWIFNGEAAPEALKLYDTQVKYGENYTYKVYSYVVVLGKRYKYSDYRLTQQIGTMDTGPDGAGDGAWDVAPVAPDGDIDYYCVQFYEPLSGELADQMFNSGVSDWTNTSANNPFHLNLHDMPAELEMTESYNRGSSETSALSQRNQFSTNQQDLTTHPQMADFMLNIEPCIKMIEIPLFKKKLKVLDSPANDMVAIPFQYMDNSKRIGFNMRYESFDQKRPYPVSITKKDRQQSIDYQNSRDILLGHDITEKASAPQRYIEVYRTDTKPTSFADFIGKLVDTIDLKIENSNYTFPDTFYTVKIPTNKKFYYVFRFVTENLVPGHMSQILECELIDDGDYIYSKFNVLADQLGETPPMAESNKVLKKLFHIEPNISQTSLDTREIDFSKTAREQVNVLQIGDAQELIWDQTFKIRLTSKKTSRQIDLNVTFEIKEEDRVNMERGDSLIHLEKLSLEESMLRWGFLTGTDPLMSYGAFDLTSEVFSTTLSDVIRAISTRPGFETYYDSISFPDETYDFGTMVELSTMEES